jgi:ribonuclease HI
MIPLHREARGLLSRFEEAPVRHVRRAQNKDADRLANVALDEKRSQLE